MILCLIKLAKLGRAVWDTKRLKDSDYIWRLSRHFDFKVVRLLWVAAHIPDRDLCPHLDLFGTIAA